MIIDELNKKIADIESLANDKTSTIESKVSDLTDGLLMVADAVDIIPEMVDEKITAITKEFSAIKDSVSKVKAQKGDNGRDGIDGLDGRDGKDGKDGSPDTPKDIADKLNTLENVIDPKVIKGSGEYVNRTDLNNTISTLENQTRFLIQSNASKGSGTGTTTTINGLSGDVTFSEGNNITLNTSGNDIEINADFTQTGKYMISGGITWSGTGLTYDVSFLQYFFNGNKTANPTQVTLDASDPTDNRFDAIVVDEAGTVTTITGTASANPEVPAIPEDQLQVTIILVAAGSTTPTIASEEIYMDDPTTGWTFSTYTTGTATGSINFAGTSSPKQGTECIEASTDARLGARFVRGTSFDAFQYTMLQVWVRFTGTAVATNKSLNVRFENSAGTLVANTVNLFSYGLQRGVLNTWQLVVVPITAFGALPATVKGLKVIMAGGTVGVVRQWDIDYMILTNGSVPYANVPTIAFYKDDVGIASQSGLNLIEGTGVTIDAVNNPLYNRVDYTLNATGGSPGGSQYNVQVNDGAGGFEGSNNFSYDYSTDSLTAGVLANVGDLQFNLNNNSGVQSIKSKKYQFSGVNFSGSGLNDLVLTGTFSGTYPTTYTVTISNTNVQSVPYTNLTGGSFTVGNTIINGLGDSGTILSDDGVTMVLQLTSGQFANGQTLDNGSGVTADTNKPAAPSDTFDWTDGTNTGTDIPMSTDPIALSNDIFINFGALLGHTIGEIWDWTYSIQEYVVQDFDSNSQIYRIGQKDFPAPTSSFGTFNFDTGVIEVVGQDIKFVTPGAGGITAVSGVTTIGAISAAAIVVDVLSEQITISNLSAYDDDTAAGVGGLTAGMVYMTTGSGSAPLNAAGILMIKQ